MDKIQAMQVFVSVVKMESFTRAATILGLPKANVSRYIRALENDVGTTLLYRTTRHVNLTADGWVYYAHCLEVLGTLEEMDSLFHGEPASLSGHLRVEAPLLLTSEFIIPHLSSFLQKYPGIELELSSLERRVDVIKEGFDCVIRIADNKTENSGLMVKPLGKMPMINCASPAYTARFGKPDSLEALSQHAMIHYNQHPGETTYGFQFCDGKTGHIIQCGKSLTVNHVQAQRAACLAGLGIIQTPEVTVKALLQANCLVDILPDFRPRPLSISVVCCPQRHLIRRVRVFTEWLIQTLSAVTD